MSNYTQTLEILDTLEEVPRALKELDDMVDADVQLGLTEIENKGSCYYTPRTETVYDVGEFGQPVAKLIEHDGCDEDVNQYFCRVRNPVTKAQATIADEMRSAGGWSDVDPEYIGYNTSYWWTPYTPEFKKTQHRNYMQVINYIFRNKDNKDQLRKGWNKFWVLWNERGTKWMSPKHMKTVRLTFNQQGISKR